MFGNLSNFLTPQTIVNFLKNNTDLNKIGMNFLNSEEGKHFIVESIEYLISWHILNSAKEK